MARRTFDVIDVCEIFTHWHAGRSKNEVAGSLGLARNTVRKYVAAAEAAGMVPGGPPVSQTEPCLRQMRIFEAGRRAEAMVWAL